MTGENCARDADDQQNRETAAEDVAAADHPGAADNAAAADARERARAERRLDEVFGSAPKVASDQREPGEKSGFSLAHYRASRPPHWGDKQ